MCSLAAPRVTQQGRENLELKARDPDPPGTLRQALGLGASDRGLLCQRDTYFHVPHGRLKLRERGAAAELIAYERSDRDGPKLSRYHVIAVSDPEGLGDALALALGVRGVVEKARRLLIWHGVRIHLNEVLGLGTFVEFEAVLDDLEGGDPNALVAELRRALGIDDSRLLAGSYVDLAGL